MEKKTRKVIPTSATADALLGMINRVSRAELWAVYYMYVYVDDHVLPFKVHVQLCIVWYCL